jgi:hypothetical protein
MIRPSLEQIQMFYSGSRIHWYRGLFSTFGGQIEDARIQGIHPFFRTQGYRELQLSDADKFLVKTR